MNNNNKEKNMRLSQVARKLNVGTDTIVAFLAKKECIIDNKPNAKITAEQFDLLAVEFVSAGMDKQEAAQVTIGKTYMNLSAPVRGHDLIKGSCRKGKEQAPTAVPVLSSLKPVEEINLPVVVPCPMSSLELPVDVSDTDVGQAVKQHVVKRDEITFGSPDVLKRLTVVGKITLPGPVSRKHQADNVGPSISSMKHLKPVDGSIKKVASLSSMKHPKPVGAFVKKAGSLKQAASTFHRVKGNRLKLAVKEREGVSAEEIQSQIKQTLAKLHQGTGESARSKYKRDKRSANLEAEDKRQRQEKEEAKVLKITEFISANELALFMNVTVNEVLSTCMALGMVISINQRLDAETISIVADEFGYNVEFVDVYDEYELSKGTEEVTGELIERPPIVTIMGHVDHGKTSLLDYIRTTKVTAKEAGGITQHIGAYDIITDQNKRIVFLDTPGHEAFTAMRTRGASITDIVVIVVAADDSIMAQTKESISHAQVAGCPIIIAINKIDKPQANPEKVKEGLANLNILVEDWGGKYQCQELSAKTGQGVTNLLDKILLEASLLELKAVPSRQAKGTIIESFLDPGRGYVATAIVQDGTLQIGDIVLAGVYYGKVKAMLNHQGVVCTMAAPAMPMQILGLNGPPRAGDTFRVMDNMKEAGELAQKKQQLLREQTLRTKSHLTLDEIGRRLAVGNFKELNIIIKGDVDGSIEALAGELLKLSHEEVQVNILHKCVGAVSESDVLLASTTGAIIISFHIKPSAQAKKLAEREGVAIKQYSIIYSAIEDVRNVIQGLLAPTIEETSTGRAEIKKIFAISKIGNIAGCQVQTGFIKQSNPIRVIRKNEVIFTGSIHTLKHGLEELKQVRSGSECGIHIKHFDKVEVGDMIEGFERKEIKRRI